MPCKTIDNHCYRTEGQREQCGNSKIEGNSRDDTCQFNQRTNNDISIIIIVDVSTRKPGIKWRHIGTTQYSIEKCQFHRLLATKINMPEIGIEGTNADKE